MVIGLVMGTPCVEIVWSVGIENRNRDALTPKGSWQLYISRPRMSMKPWFYKPMREEGTKK
jgi:hypothetical protein